MTEPSQTAEELHTWKEIAEFLQVSVRTAKYWEEHQGLPVLRGPGEKSRVWALKSDLQTWRANRIRIPECSPHTSEPLTAARVGPTPQSRRDQMAEPVLNEAATSSSFLDPAAKESRTIVLPPVSVPNVQGATAPRGVSRRSLLGLISGGSAVVAASYLLFRHAELPSRAVLTGKLLTVMDPLGRTLWTHEFPLGQRIEPEPWQVQVLDLHGTGRPGVLVVCNFVTDGGGREPGKGEIFYFGSDGSIQWRLPCQPNILDCDGRSFESDWNCSHLIVTRQDGEYVIWAGVRHGIRFPGVILRVDSRGESRIHVANAGNIDRLNSFNINGKEFIVFDGVNNAFDRPCVGLVGTDDPPSVSPPGGSRLYQFVGGPTGELRSYVLFPTTEFDLAMNSPYARPGAVEVPQGSISLEVGYQRYTLQYVLSDTLEPRFVSPSGSYSFGHRHFEEQGILKHSWTNCPELKHPLKLRRFDPTGGWRDEEIPWR